jgi:hypothetical protein
MARETCGIAICESQASFELSAVLKDSSSLTEARSVMSYDAACDNTVVTTE